MTTKKFKKLFPQHAHLEGDALWDKMTSYVLEQGDVLYADPNQIKVFHPPVDIGDGMKVSIEDSSTTRWLNSKGELVRVGEELEPVLTSPTTSYRMEIIDFGKYKEE